MITYSNSANVDLSGVGFAIVQSVYLSPPVGTQWQVYHLAVSSSPIVGGKLFCNVFIDGVFWCGTSVGSGDSADGTPLKVAQSQQLQFAWISQAAFPAVWPVGQGIVTLTASILVEEGNP